ncbi:MAG: hypothetical protein AB1Z20_12640 [Desulfobacterales bacterium]
MINRGSGQQHQHAACRLERKAEDKVFKDHLDGYDMLDYFKKCGESDGV